MPYRRGIAALEQAIRELELTIGASEHMAAAYPDTILNGKWAINDGRREWIRQLKTLLADEQKKQMQHDFISALDMDGGDDLTQMPRLLVDGGPLTWPQLTGG